MTQKTKANATTRLLTYLSKDVGNTTLTVAQARARFKIANPTARIADLRRSGVNVRTVMKEGRDGVERAVYSLVPAKVTRRRQSARS